MSVTAEDLMRIVERLSDGIILFDRDGRLLYLNAEAGRILRRSLAELVGKPFRESMPDVVALLIESSRERMLAGEEVLLVRSFFAQGRWFEILGRPLDETLLVHFHDITERLQAEAARRRSEQRFEILVNGVTDYAIVMLDPKGNVASWTASAERISGYPAGEILGEPVARLYPPELRGDVDRRLEEVVQRGSVQAEGRFFRRDGTPYVATTVFTSLVDELGAPSGFAVVAQDVTRRRELEEWRRIGEERLRLALEAGAVGTWEDVAGDGMLFDAQAVRICGLATDRPSFAELLTSVHPEDRAPLDEKRRDILHAEPGSEFELEYRTLAEPQKRPRWIEVRGRVLESLDGSGRGRVIGVVRDRTRHHEVEEFRQLAAGVIAHDLRAPLAAVQLASRLLIEREGLTPGAVGRVRSIVGKVDRMVHMVRRLLLYTQAEFGEGIPLDSELTDLVDVCRAAIADVESASPKSEIHFGSEGDCRGVWDRIGLTEVVDNLVENAVQHGQPGQPIHVVARDEGDAVLLVVRNSGPPIPPELLPVIFEPFRRVDDRRGFGGDSFGLGLYIVREIVVAHGGTVEVSSSRAAGTTFTVRLPRGAPSHPFPGGTLGA
jgi:PAS domain S-box-containing protein